MILDTYIRIVRALLFQPEIRIAIQLFRGILFAIIAGLILLALFHTLYYLGHHTPLYRRKAPIDGWNKRFFTGLVCLFATLAGIIVLLSRVI